MSIKLERIIDVLILLLIFTLTSLRSLILWVLFPDTLQLSGLAWREILIWVLLLILILYVMHKRDLFENYVLIWRKHPVLIAFILFSIISIFWSITWTGTLYRSLALLFTTFVAVYLGRRYSLEELIQILFWVGVIVVIASFFLAMVYPNVGRDFNPPFNGAWRGIYWHKNHLGNIIPVFTLAFLLRIFQRPFHFFHFEKITAIIFYLLSLVLVYQARSASGYILLLIIHFVFVISIIWINVYTRLKPIHYWSALALFLAVVILIALNLDFVFGLFNRETSLTGRAPLWQYLIKDVFWARPIMGYGFGSLWTLESFRLSVKEVVGWGYPVMIGDNGFLDILLNGGIVGFALFLIVYARVWFISVHYSMIHRTVIGMFPLIFVLYTLFANISFSLFLETESFIWLLCMYLLFIEIPRPLIRDFK